MTYAGVWRTSEALPPARVQKSLCVDMGMSLFLVSIITPARLATFVHFEIRTCNATALGQSHCSWGFISRTGSCGYRGTQIFKHDAKQTAMSATADDQATSTEHTHATRCEQNHGQQNYCKRGPQTNKYVTSDTCHGTTTGRAVAMGQTSPNFVHIT